MDQLRVDLGAADHVHSGDAQVEGAVVRRERLEQARQLDDVRLVRPHEGGQLGRRGLRGFHGRHLLGGIANVYRPRSISGKSRYKPLSSRVLPEAATKRSRGHPDDVGIAASAARLASGLLAMTPTFMARGAPQRMKIA